MNFTLHFLSWYGKLISERKRRKITKARRKQDSKKETLVKAILNKYQPESVEDMQNALKISLAPCLKQCCKGKWRHIWDMNQKTDRKKK